MNLDEDYDENTPAPWLAGCGCLLLVAGATVFVMLGIVSAAFFGAFSHLG